MNSSSTLAAFAPVPFMTRIFSEPKIPAACGGTYGGYWGNEIPRVDQNQHHCLVEKGDLLRLREETPTENQPAQRLKWQPRH